MNPHIFPRLRTFLKYAPLALALLVAAPASAQQVFSGRLENVSPSGSIRINDGLISQEFVCGNYSNQCMNWGCPQLGRRIRVHYNSFGDGDPGHGGYDKITHIEWLPGQVDMELNHALCEAHKAENGGRADAAKINSLGVWHERGKHGFQKNAAKAYEYYELAASHGNALAMHNLGDLYRQGKGVLHDGAQAFEWYRKAAQAGHAIGLEDMGDCYLNGIGVAHNRDEAVRLYRQAAQRGRKSAAQKLHRLGE